MIRAIPDMLASYGDMLDRDPYSPDNWLNFRLPSHYTELSPRSEGRFPGRHGGPWYASYFATWMEYAAEAPERVLALEYENFTADPAGALEKLLFHSGMPQYAPDLPVWRWMRCGNNASEYPLQQGVSAGAGAHASRATRSRGWNASSNFIPISRGMKDKLIPPSAP